MRAEEPLDDEPADPAAGSRDLWDSVRSAFAVRLDLVRLDQRSGESAVGLSAQRRCGLCAVARGFPGLCPGTWLTTSKRAPTAGPVAPPASGRTHEDELGGACRRLRQ